MNVASDRLAVDQIETITAEAVTLVLSIPSAPP